MSPLGFASCFPFGLHGYRTDSAVEYPSVAEFVCSHDAPCHCDDRCHWADPAVFVFFSSIEVTAIVHAMVHHPAVAAIDLMEPVVVAATDRLIQPVVPIAMNPATVAIAMLEAASIGLIQPWEVPPSPMPTGPCLKMLRKAALRNRRKRCKRTETAIRWQ